MAQGLRLAGIRPPDEVDWDWMENGRVSGKRAVMMWNASSGIVVLVDVASGIAHRERVIAVEPKSTSTTVAAMLRPFVEETQ